MLDRFEASEFKQAYFALLIGVLLFTAARQLSAEEKVFRAGAYAMEITPPKFPISVNGGMSDHFAKGAHDPLHARCLVLDDGLTKIALVACDSCMILRQVHDSAQQVTKLTGIPVSNILISATHTHSAPSFGPTRRGPPESCIIARSTRQVTISPGATEVTPAARAMIFCLSVNLHRRDLRRGGCGCD